MPAVMVGGYDLRASPTVYPPARAPAASKLLHDGPLHVVGSAVEYGCAGDCVCLLAGVVYGDTPAALTAASLAASFLRQGETILPRLRGDFILLFWHTAARRGVIARDQLGGPGLHFASNGECFVFASEIVDVLELLPRRPEPDEVALAHWLVASGPPDGRTLFDGIRRLPGGHLLELDRDGVRQRAWWHPLPRPVAVRGFDDAADGLREHLRTAVQRRVNDCQRLGVMLSGGLDSATVAAFARDAGAQPRAYSALFPHHPSVDESALINKLREELGLEGGTAANVVGGSLLDGLIPFVSRWSLPPTSPNLFFWDPLLARAAADGVLVMLDGEGGDEVFGTPRFLLADRVRRGRVVSAWQLTRRFPRGSGARRREVLAVLAEYGVLGALPAGAHRAARALVARRQRAPAWLRPQTARLLDCTDRWAWKRTGGSLAAAGLLEAVTGTSGAVPARDHVRLRNAGAGIEARHPLLDVDIVEYVLGLDPELALHRSLNRPVLRRAAAGYIPDDVRLRPSKSTFDALFFESLAGRDLPAATALLMGPDAQLGARVELSLVREYLLDRPGRQSPLGVQWWAIHLWRLLTAECWLRSEAGALEPLRRTSLADVRLSF